MMALLSRLALRRSIGLVIDDKAVAMSVVVTTPLGRRQVFHDVQALGSDSPQAVLGRLLDPWTKRGRCKKTQVGAWVQVGVPESQVFQAVVPDHECEPERSPAVVFPRGGPGDQRPRRGAD